LGLIGLTFARRAQVRNTAPPGKRAKVLFWIEPGTGAIRDPVITANAGSDFGQCFVKPAGFARTGAPFDV
jgi:hypothetical protein